MVIYTMGPQFAQKIAVFPRQTFIYYLNCGFLLGLSYLEKIVFELEAFLKVCYFFKSKTYRFINIFFK